MSKIKQDFVKRTSLERAMVDTTDKNAVVYETLSAGLSHTDAPFEAAHASS